MLKKKRFFLKKKHVRIGLDAMGGDYAPQSAVCGAILAQKELPSSVEIVLIGEEDKIVQVLLEQNENPEDYNIVHAPEVITMSEHPTKAYSRKKRSSIAIGFNLLKTKEIDAFAGAGNTGAMLVGSIFSVNAIQGVIRPCTTSIIPKENGSVGIILDIGTNPDCKPDVMYQFGVLGSLYAKYVFNIKNPKVGLLNIGEEEEKGNLLCQSAYRIMKDTKDFDFIGNIEGRDIYKDNVDVIVCDGFTGNVILKQIEAMYSILVKRKLTDSFIDRFNYENYGGTPILGINSSVIIGHGISNAKAIKNMILHSKEVHESNIHKKIKRALKKIQPDIINV